MRQVSAKVIPCIERAMDLNPATETADVAVIGAGAAGLLAGIGAARAGARTVVYERMATPARKIAIAGGGRCNFTNTLDARAFVRRFGDTHAAKLGHALRAFSNDELLALLARHGVEGQVERGYRIFTKSGRGSDVAEALVAELKEAGAALVCDARISALRRGAAFILEGRFGGCDERRKARTVVVCTGGLSYPTTGSSGDGYAWARALGHTVTPLRAALVGLTVEETWPAALQGLSWPDAEAALGRHGRDAHATKPLGVERGEILFTHFGISGPAILDLSNVLVASGLQRAALTVDFLPDVRREELDAQLLARLRQYPNRTVARALEGFMRMPPRLLEHFETALEAGGSPLAGRLTKEARQRLLGLLKQTSLVVNGTRSVEHGEVTAGGVAWGEIEPATLESRVCPSLFFAGEILDVAGRCGGFNLQAAFSTGFLAGRSAARRALGRIPEPTETPRSHRA
ncbi:MAG: aminoacetone oxidase family FAD-binding enzyme [Planctomycetota bacterium]|nr:aminoacetone oxidase family FAD-binding enzyme [Planctomycetota bacterium]